MLKTETPAQDHACLDQYPTAELVEVLVDDQLNAINAVRAAAPGIAAAVTAANGDMAKARADTDPIVAKYQPDADAFGYLLGRFFTSMPEGPEKAQVSAMAPMVTAQIKGVPAQARDAALAPPAAAEAPVTPATPQ